MSKFCKLCGADTTAEGFSSPLHKMCLNCKWVNEEISETNDTFTCSNEKVMEKGRNAILAAVPDGFEIDTLTLKPYLLKNPTKKCPNYEPDMDAIYAEIDKIFK